MIVKNNVSAEEYERKNRAYHLKLEKGEALTPEEVAFVCDCLPFKSLLLYPFCNDEFFHRAFVARNSDDINPPFKLEERHHIIYESLVREWSRVVSKTNHSDQLLQVISKETRDELKKLKESESPLNWRGSLSYIQRDLR